MKPLTIFRKLYGYLKKDLMLFYKRKKYLYMFVLFPIIIAAIFLFLMTPSMNEIDVGVCNFDQSPQSREAFTNLEGFSPVVLEEEGCIENLNEKIKKGELALGLEIGEDFSDKLENLKQATITIYYDNTDIAFANLVSWKVDLALNPFKRDVINKLNNELKKRVSIARDSIGALSGLSRGIGPLNTRIEDVDSDLKNVEELNTDFLVNPIWTEKIGIYETTELKFISISFLFPIVSLFLILMLASTSLIYDRKSGFLTKVKTSTTPLVYLLAKLIFFFILSLIILLTLLFLFLIAGAQFSLGLPNLFEILKLVLSIAIINSLLGLIIGNISENEGVAVLISLIISFPLMLLSGLFFPVQTMPSFIRSLIKILPLHYQIEASKSVLLFGQGLGWQWIYFGLALFAAVFYFIRKE